MRLSPSIASRLSEIGAPSPARRSLVPRLRLLVLLALAIALLAQGWIPRDARACGDDEIDYGPEKPVIVQRPGHTEIGLNYRRMEHSFAGGNYNFSEIRVFTRDAAFIAWLQKEGMGEAMWKRLLGASEKLTCADLMEGTRIARLEQALAKVVASAYREATRKSTPRPDLMLVSDVLGHDSPTCTPPNPTR